MITFEIDELVPCLKNVETGEIIETEVIKIVRKSVLSKYNKRTGWYVNWAELSNDAEIYALVIKGSYDVQGMIAIKYEDDSKAVHIKWACVSPENNIAAYEHKKYSGVGGHLFAIASELSERKGYDGFVYGEAINQKVLNHYCNEFGALSIPSYESPYKFMVSEEMTEKIRRTYSYEWTDEIL